MLPYPWLNAIYSQILRSYSIKKGHHALLFHSPWNQGEEVLINFIARWLICENPDKKSFCNICKNCYLMNLKQHPDYYQLHLEHNNKFIGVDEIRSCINSIQYSTRYSRSKVIFINHIECLTNQAMHILLKILEEPPNRTYFLLKTKTYKKIPITLLSRCIKLSIPTPKESVGLTWLTKKLALSDTISAQTALRLCQQAPIEASAILKSKNWEKRLESYKILDHVLTEHGNFLEILPYFMISQNDNKFLYWFITLLIDALKMQQKTKKQFLINLDQLKLITIISEHWNILSLNNQVRQWQILFRYFQKFDTINHELLLTYRLLNWKNGFIETYL